MYRTDEGCSSSALIGYPNRKQLVHLSEVRLNWRRLISQTSTIRHTRAGEGGKRTRFRVDSPTHGVVFHDPCQNQKRPAER